MALPDYSGLYGQQQKQRQAPQNQRFRGYMGPTGKPPTQIAKPGQQQVNQNYQALQETPVQGKPYVPVVAPQPAQGTKQTSDFILPPLTPTPGAGTNPPQAGLNNPFFDPNSNYIPSGSQGNNVNFFNTAGDPNPGTLGNIYGTEESPEGYYYALLNQNGLGGLDARSRAAQSMYGDYARGYQAAKMYNSELMFPQFMGMNDVPNLVQMLSDEQLGIDRNQYRGALNWTMRG